MSTLRRLIEEGLFPSFAAVSPSANRPVRVSGLDGPALAAFLGTQYWNPRDLDASFLLVAPDVRSAEVLADDLRAWVDEDEVLLFPGFDLRPYEWRTPFGQILERRLACFQRLASGKRGLYVTTLAALRQKLPPPQFSRREVISLATGQEIDLGDLRANLLHMGFEEERAVEEMGQFSVRGGIIDLYPFLMEDPVRIELFGDVIESIREFDIFSQRSSRDLGKVEVQPMDECCFSDRELQDGLFQRVAEFPDEGALDAELRRLSTRRDLSGLVWQRPLFCDVSHSLLSHFARPPLVYLWRDEGWEGALQELEAQAAEGFGEARGLGRVVPRPEELFFSLSQLRKLLEGKALVHVGDLGEALPGIIHFAVDPQPAGAGNLASVQGVFEELAATNHRIFLSAPNEGQAERLRSLLQDMPVDEVLAGNLSAGFILRADRVAVFADHRIFHRQRTPSASRKFKFRGGGVPIPSFEALDRDDYVVHRDYGLGRYLGIRRMRVDDHQVDCILLQFEGADRLTIPVTDLGKIQKYAAQEGDVPHLSRLGGKEWEQAKERTRRAVAQLAKELVELYARRLAVPGFAFSAGGPMLREFEEAFVYPPTPDQLSAITQTNQDMEKPKPMDRLICGDVGFGKTEVAMRAAMKAVLDKKQVAVVAPTTVLVAQHFATFSERFSAFPVNIDFLNRFKTPAEQKRTLARVAEGAVDILIGTHRLFSADLRWKDLGLVVVDEEQKFGVKQKERLKEVRTQVDVLSLSATPIPRSLHMSLVGARDFSVILTPPRDRLPVETRVVQWDPALVREALRRELARGGQVFFVHHRVLDLADQRDLVQAMVPDARVGMAHGQMGEDLEGVMLAFVNREYDILVTTSIIESGIDIPNANTIIVNRAEYFGLSQLFQMRGRVGRSATQAYCLLIAPEEARFTDVAKKRLYSLQRFTELGSGYQLAMRDLEIRGAGNILGLEQSGHIQAVGFDTYCGILKEAMSELMGRHEIPPPEPELILPESAFLPEDYVEDGLQRISLYQKLARCETPAEVEELSGELRDRFGPLPAPALVLLCGMRARIAARAAGFGRVELREGRLFLDYAAAFQPEGPALEKVAGALKQAFHFRNERPLKIVVEVPGRTPAERLEKALRELEALAEAAAPVAPLPPAVALSL